MTLKDMTEGLAWFKKNRGRRLTDEEKAWIIEKIRSASTVGDLVGAVLEFVNKG